MKRRLETTRNNIIAPVHRPGRGCERGPRWLRRCLFILLLAVFSAKGFPVWASPPASDERDAASHFMRGEAKEGRALYLRALEKDVDDCVKSFTPADGWPEWFDPYDVSPTPGDPSVSAEEWAEHLNDKRYQLLRDRSIAVAEVNGILQAWMGFEAKHRAKTGEPIPAEVFDAIYGALTPVAPYSEILSASREWAQTATPKEGRKKRAEWYLHRALQWRGDALRDALVFLRGSHLESKREKLFEATRRHRAAFDPEMELPETLQEFDARHPNAGKFFGYHPPKPTPRNRPTPTPEPPRVKLAPDHPIVVFARRLIEKTVEGDLTYLRDHSDPGVFPEDDDEVQEITEKAREYRLQSMSGVYAVDIGNNKFDVSVDEVTTIDGNGKYRTGPANFVLRKTAEGQYRISYPKRNAGRKREGRNRHDKK